jgi:hypothetical protein
MGLAGAKGSGSLTSALMQVQQQQRDEELQQLLHMVLQVSCWKGSSKHTVTKQLESCALLQTGYVWIRTVICMYST